MTGLHHLIRRWQIAHYEQESCRAREAGRRSEIMLGAYGLSADGQPARLPTT